MEKQKQKKPFYKRWWFILLVAIFVIGAIGSGGDDETEEITNVSKKEEEVEEIKEDTSVEDEEDIEVSEELEDVEEAKRLESEQKVLEKMSLDLMKDSFEGIADVTYNDTNEAFILLPTDDGLVNEIILLSTGDEDMLEGWESMVTGIVSMSQSIKESLGNGYSIHLLNPANTDNVILSCVDGVVIYDLANDL